MHDAQILVAIVPAEIKDDVVDILIALESISGFNLTRIAGYSREHSHFSLREQVEGHREMYRFEVMHERAQEEALIRALGRVCAVARARYWILPVMGQGHFGDLSPES
jgi:hypothetical protein